MPDLNPKTSQARVESSLFSSAAMTVNGVSLGNTSATNWQMRTAALRTFYLPLASRAAVDLGLAITHTFQAAAVGLNVTGTLYAALDLTEATGAIKNGQKLWTGAIPYDARFVFASERGSGGDSSDPLKKVIEVPELRQPIHKFILELTPASVPDAGDLYVRAIWRF